MRRRDSARRGDEAPDGGVTPSPTWRDPKRYLWLLGSTVPGLLTLSWLLVQLTGHALFWWTGAILTFMVMPLADWIVGAGSDTPTGDALEWLQHDRFYRWTIYLYLPGQYLTLIFACWLWSGGGWVTMTFVDKLGVMLTVGIVGGFAINAAHELGHNRASMERTLSRVALAQTGYGHFSVEHNRGHHVRVATPEDPASSRMGESLYHFIPRSVIGGMRSAWSIERRRLSRARLSMWSWHNEVLTAWAMSVALLVALAVWFGVVVLPWLAGQAIIGFCLLESANYMEHYGLRRQKLPNGRYERVGPRHSWNSDTVIANIFLFHLQRHSDHHMHPGRRYQTLRHDQEAPQLPSGYGSMFLIALVPALWRRVMDPLVLEHYGGEVRLAALHPPREKLLLQRYGAFDSNRA